MTEKTIEPETDDARASDTGGAKKRREALEESARKGFKEAVANSNKPPSDETGDPRADADPSH